MLLRQENFCWPCQRRLAFNEHRLITAALVGLTLAASAQRAGAVKNATIGEFKARERIGDYEMISVRHHKTYSSGGAALLPLNNDLASLLATYIMHVRERDSQRINGRLLHADETIFATPTGETLTNSQFANLVPRQMGLKIVATNLRKTTATRVRQRSRKGHGHGRPNGPFHGHARKKLQCPEQARLEC